MSLPPWLVPLADRLRSALAADTLPHAILISAPPGWGDGVLGNWLALTLLGADVDRDASQLAHPDLRWLVPDGAEIKVDMVREVNALCQGTAQGGARKVAVLAEAHALNRAAANALLKTLEEPPPGTHLLLCSDRPTRLLPTVRSRCQAVVIRPDAEQARRWLAARVPEADLDRLLFEHGGAPLAAAAAAAAGEPSLEPVLLDALQPGRRAAVLAALQQPDLVDALARWYRYVLALAAGTWRPPALAGASGRAVAQFATELVWVRRQLLTSNSANGTLLSERLLSRWRRLATL